MYLIPMLVNAERNVVCYCWKEKCVDKNMPNTYTTDNSHGLCVLLSTNDNNQKVDRITLIKRGRSVTRC